MCTRAWHYLLVTSLSFICLMATAADGQDDPVPAPPAQESSSASPDEESPAAPVQEPSAADPAAPPPPTSAEASPVTEEAQPAQPGPATESSPASPQASPASQPSSSAPQIIPAVQVSPMAQAGPELQKRMKTRVSVDFRETPIEDVIKSFAQQADVDIVKGPMVTGKVTASLSNVPLEEAMDSIFAVHGYGYITSESIIRIVPRNQLAQFTTKFVTKTYHIDYASMTEVTKAITPMLTTQGKMTSNPKTRDVWVTDTEDNVKALDEFIKKMDGETPQILVEARIYDVSCSAFLDLGFDWSAGTYTLFDEETGLAVGGKTEPFFRSGFGSSIGQAPKADFGLRLGVLDGKVDIDATLTARKDDIHTRLLANPKIMVLNDQQATIKIVEEIPYQELTQTSGGGNIGTTKFKEVGVELMVTPRITREGKILLTISPTFSVQTGTVALAIPAGLSAISSPQPIVDTRKATTQALISDGQTVVIGGLRKQNVTHEISKVPILGDVPVLGLLFQFKGEKAVNSELIVFITPQTVVKPELGPQEAEKLERMENTFCEPKGPAPMYNCCEGED